LRVISWGITFRAERSILVGTIFGGFQEEWLHVILVFEVIAVRELVCMFKGLGSTLVRGLALGRRGSGSGVGSRFCTSRRAEKVTRMADVIIVGVEGKGFKH
jgi:hypothetical protein